MANAAEKAAAEKKAAEAKAAAEKKAAAENKAAEDKAAADKAAADKAARKGGANPGPTSNPERRAAEKAAKDSKMERIKEHVPEAVIDAMKKEGTEVEGFSFKDDEKVGLHFAIVGANGRKYKVGKDGKMLQRPPAPGIPNNPKERAAAKKAQKLKEEEAE